MEIMYTFPNLYPGTKTTIVLKQPKTEGSVRVVKSPNNVLEALSVLKKMQGKLKEELGQTVIWIITWLFVKLMGVPL